MKFNIGPAPAFTDLFIPYRYLIPYIPTEARPILFREVQEAKLKAINQTIQLLHSSDMTRRNSQRDLVELSKEIIYNFQSSIRLWSVKRRETIQTLRRLADELMEHHKNVHIAKVSGSSASVVGFILVATGFGLASAAVSLGTSLILSAVGGAFCSAGGATIAGSSIAERHIFKTELENAQEIIDADRKAQEPVQKLLDEMSKLSWGCVKEYVVFGQRVASMVKNLVDVGKGVKAGARVATTAASEGAEAVVRSVGIGFNAVRIGMFAVSAVLLPLDIYTLVQSSRAIDSARKGEKDKEPEAVKKLREVANGLETEMNKMLQNVDEFQKQIQYIKTGVQ